MEASEAPTPQTMVLVIADVDRFKAVNDTCGHRAGDAVLQAVGRIMTQRLAGYGLVGRLGGEEFALISSNASLEQIIPALHDLLLAIETTPFVTPGGAVRITLSAGVAIGISPNRSSGFIQRLTRCSTWPSAPGGTGSNCRPVLTRLSLPVERRITKTSHRSETRECLYNRIILNLVHPHQELRRSQATPRGRCADAGPSRIQGEACGSRSATIGSRPARPSP